MSQANNPNIPDKEPRYAYSIQQLDADIMRWIDVDAKIKCPSPDTGYEEMRATLNNVQDWECGSYRMAIFTEHYLDDDDDEKEYELYDTRIFTINKKVAF